MAQNDHRTHLRRRTFALAISLAATAFMLPAAAPAMPANDECVAATVIADYDFDQTLDTSAATTAPGDPLQSCTTGGAAQNAASVWYSFTPPISGFFGFSTITSDYDTVLAYYTGGCGAPVEYRCDDNFWSPTGASAYSTRVLADVEYLAEVTAHGAGPAGTLELGFFFVPDSPVCATGESVEEFEKARLKVSGLGGAAGRQQLRFAGRMRTAPVDVAAAGVQFTVEDGEDAFTPLFDRSHRTVAIPASGVPGCGASDGWTSSPKGVHRYENKSGVLPPACTPGSAAGVAKLVLKPSGGDDDGYRLKVRIRDGAVTAPTGFGDDLRVAFAIGTTVEAGTTGPCAVADGPAFDCRANPRQTAIKCRGY